MQSRNLVQYLEQKIAKTKSDRIYVETPIKWMESNLE